MKLNEGDLAPDFEYIDKKGEHNQFHDLSGLKVIFFFPKAFTPGCTKESCSIQSNYSELKELGVTEIFGISLDSKDKQNAFAKKYNLDYIFVSDQNGKVSKDYGVYRNKILFKFADRDTYIVDSQNIIVKILQNGLTGSKSEFGLDKHGSEIIKAINSL